jgi:NAD(P)-dependent dehydrogenase (short-subunit alcohol dehydrogenase family)
VSITSDIGSELAKRYIRDGNSVVGTYRTKPNSNIDNIFYCNIDYHASIRDFIQTYSKLNFVWDTLILCPSNPLPIKPFFECRFDDWEETIHTNSIGQLNILHKLYPFRNKTTSNVVFFAAGGVNNTTPNFSAYTTSKIMLIKMCELLDSENKDMSFIAVGPGFIHTKIHDVILNNSNDEMRTKTLNYIESGNKTSMDEIYDSIAWLCSKGKKVSGRNFSIVNDELGSGLLEELDKDENMYKLRRYRNG